MSNLIYANIKCKPTDMLVLVNLYKCYMLVILLEYCSVIFSPYYDV